MTTNTPWAALFETEPDRVTLRFTSPLRSIALTADSARRFAAKLLILAEAAEQDGAGTATKIHPAAASPDWTP